MPEMTIESIISKESRSIHTGKQWRIQDFQYGGTNPWILIDKNFAEICMKIKEIEPRGGRPNTSHPWIRQWKV